MRKYGYMIKTAQLVDGKIVSHYDNSFEYPKKKGALVEAKSWNPKPECGGGIHGLIHETRFHYIHQGDIWLILRYLLDEAIEISQEKIKVPRAWVIAWGTAEKIQKKFGELTGKPYQYQYAVQTTEGCSIQTAKYNSTQKAGDDSIQIARSGSNQTVGDDSIQIAGFSSNQTAGDDSIQIAEYNSTQKARDNSTQIAGNGSTQIARYGSAQLAWNRSTQTAGDYSIQRAGENSAQTAGDHSIQRAACRSIQIAGYASTQIARDNSTQTAKAGSVSIIRGTEGFCKHQGEVLQILVFKEKGKYIFLHKLITDNKKHYLRAIKENGEWNLIDTVID